MSSTRDAMIERMNEDELVQIAAMAQRVADLERQIEAIRVARCDTCPVHPSMEGVGKLVRDLAAANAERDGLKTAIESMMFTLRAMATSANEEPTLYRSLASRLAEDARAALAPADEHTTRTKIQYAAGPAPSVYP